MGFYIDFVTTSQISYESLLLSNRNAVSRKARPNYEMALESCGQKGPGGEASSLRRGCEWHVFYDSLQAPNVSWST